MPQLRKAVVVKDDAPGRGDLYRGGLLAPPIAHPLERCAPPAAIADRIGGIIDQFARKISAALLAGIALRSRWLQPACMAELQPAKFEIVDRFIIAARDRHQMIQLWQDDIDPVHILVRTGLVIELARFRIDEPLAWFAQEGERVHQEEARDFGRYRPRDRVIADQIVAPPRLLHDDPVAFDTVDRGMAMSEPTHALHFDPLLIGQLRQKAPGRVLDLQSPRMESDGGPRDFDRCPWREFPRDSQLPGVRARRNAGRPDIPLFVDLPPTGDRLTARQDGACARRALPPHRIAILTAVPRAKAQGGVQAVGSRRQGDRHIMVAIEAPHRLLRADQRGEGLARRSIAVVRSLRRHMQDDRRRCRAVRDDHPEMPVFGPLRWGHAGNVRHGGQLRHRRTARSCRDGEQT